MTLTLPLPNLQHLLHPVDNVIQIVADCSHRAEDFRKPHPDYNLPVCTVSCRPLHYRLRSVAEDPNLMGLEQGFLHLLTESPLPAIRLDAVACLGRLALIGPVASDGARRDGLALKFWPHWSRIAASDVEDPAVSPARLPQFLDACLIYPLTWLLALSNPPTGLHASFPRSRGLGAHVSYCGPEGHSGWF